METMLLKPDNLVEGKILLNKPLGEALTFSRVGAKNVLDARGELKKLTDNYPPLTFRPDGSMAYRFEPTRTNLFPYANTQDWYVLRATRGTAETKNGIEGYYYNGTGIVPTIYKGGGTTLQSYYSVSVFVDVSNATNKYTLALYTELYANRVKYTFNVSDKTFVRNQQGTEFQNDSAKWEHIAGDIWRISLSAETIIAPSVIVACYIEFSDNAQGVWLGGAQLEAGDGATSLIETTGSTLQRLYDSASLGNLFTNGLLTATAGAVYVELDAEQLIRESSSSLFDLGSSNGRFYIKGITTALANPRISPRISVQSTDSSTENYTLLQKSNKIIFNYSASNVDVWVNGVKVITTGKAFSLTNETMTLSGAGRQYDLKTIAMWNSTQTDEFCQNLTTTG